MATMKITAIILAAGQSHRFGESNKLFADFKGSPLINHCLNTVLGFDFDNRILVTGFEYERMNRHINGLPLRCVHNSDYAQGMGASLADGVKMLDADCDAFMVFLADMPDISKDIIQQLIDAFDNGQKTTIARPVYKGKPGHPVLFASSHRNELSNLVGDRGAAAIIKQHKASTVSVEVSSRGVIRDVDRLGDLD